MDCRRRQPSETPNPPSDGGDLSGGDLSGGNEDQDNHWGSGSGRKIADVDVTVDAAAGK